VKEQVPLLQAAVPCWGAAQGEQLEPQLPTLLSGRQALPQLCVPVGQVEVVPQVVPLQVGAVLGGIGQGVQLVPQWATLSLLTQTPLQR